MTATRHDEVPASTSAPPLPPISGCKSAEQQTSSSSQNTEVKVGLIPVGLLIKPLV